MTTLGSLIETYGYWLLAADSLLEGETVLVLAGFSVRRGHLYLFAVLGIASVGSFAGNQLYFWLGRRHGRALLARWPSVAEQSDRINRLIVAYPATVIIGIRFVYGLRIAGPVVIGMSQISAPRFGLLNALGAVLWACLIAASAGCLAVPPNSGWTRSSTMKCGCSWGSQSAPSSVGRQEESAGADVKGAVHCTGGTPQCGGANAAEASDLEAHIVSLEEQAAR